MCRYEEKGIVWLYEIYFMLAAVMFVIFVAVNSVTLTCNSLERHYVKCQQKRLMYYGLWSESTPTFRLRGAEVEEYTDTDSEGNDHDAYKLYLDTGDKRIYFYEYGSDFESAYADRGRILDLLIGIGEPSLTLSKGANK